MKLAVEFPSVVYREGPKAVARLAGAMDEIGFDQLDIFDHVVMGHDTEGREKNRYPAKMPIMEAFATLGYVAACTSRIGLGTEVLVLPQRDPVLTAKQASTLDTLSGGRLRLGLGVGWQESEYEAMGQDFRNRGRRMDEAIAVLRACWGQDPIDFEGEFYRVEAMAMEPKPPRGADLPIWIGGHSEAAFRRAGRYGDGWMGVASEELFENGDQAIASIRGYADRAGRDPEALEFQAQVSPPPRPGNESDRTFYTEPDRVAEAAAKLGELGFGSVALNLTGLFLAGARSVDAMIDGAGALHDRLRAELG